MPNSRKSDFIPRRRSRIYDLFHLIVQKFPRTEYFCSYGAARRECCSDYSEPLRETASAPRSDGRSGFPCTCSIFPCADSRCNPRTKIFLGSAVFIAPYRPAVNEMEFLSVRADWQTTFIDREIYRSVWIIAIFLVLAFFFIHGKLHEFFHAVFFAVEIIIIAAIT